MANTASVLMKPKEHLKTYAVEEYDGEHSDTDEQQFQMIAWSGRRILFVVYTMRGEKYRIISAREAKKHERELYERQRSEDAYGQ